MAARLPIRARTFLRILTRILMLNSIVCFSGMRRQAPRTRAGDNKIRTVLLLVKLFHAVARLLVLPKLCLVFLLIEF
jgi:hypothetical protein